MNGKIFAALRFFLCLLYVFCLCACNRPEEQKPREDTERQDAENIEPFITFIDNWNGFADNLAPRFSLVGDKILDAATLKHTLEQWCAVFVRKPDVEFTEQLNALERESPSAFEEYAIFQAKQRRSSKIDLATAKDGSELAKSINAWLGLKNDEDQQQDNLTYETMELIIFMNSFCTFFEKNKESLHRLMVVDRYVERCHQLSTKGKFPALDKIIDE